MFLVISVGFMYPSLREIAAPNLDTTLAQVFSNEIVNSYESGGASGFIHFVEKNNIDDREQTIYLLDSYYKDVLGRPIEDDALYTAKAARLGRVVL